MAMMRRYYIINQTIKQLNDAMIEIKKLEEDKNIIKEDRAILLSKEDRMKTIDIIKFYSDWLYAPVDEEIENKLYFVDLDDNNSIEKYCKDKLDKIYEPGKTYGIRYINKL